MTMVTDYGRKTLNNEETLIAESDPIQNGQSDVQREYLEANLSRRIAAGEFKAKCLSLLDEVSKTGQTLIITKFGKPVAQLQPMPIAKIELRGAMRGSVLWEGDIISPVEDEWEANQ